MHSKRCRGSNFSVEEELLLLEEIGKQKQNIECKTTNKVSNEEKEEAWQLVLHGFNAKTLRLRTMEQIKGKYDNLKTKARKAVAAEKTYIKGTGGGKCMKTENPVIDAVLNILNVKTVVGLQPEFDCDAVVLNAISPTTSVDEIALVQTVEVEVHDDALAALPSCSYRSAESAPLLAGAKETVNVETITSRARPSTSRTSSTSSSTPDIEKNWSSYVPRNLLKRTHAKLRPTNSTPSRELYYQRKLELLEAAEAHEAEERLKKSKRDEEEHQKKMMLLDLELQLKKKN